MQIVLNFAAYFDREAIMSLLLSGYDLHVNNFVLMKWESSEVINGDDNDRS